jgi:hypothetical protein
MALPAGSGAQYGDHEDQSGQPRQTDNDEQGAHALSFR